MSLSTFYPYPDSQSQISQLQATQPQLSCLLVLRYVQDKCDQTSKLKWEMQPRIAGSIKMMTQRLPVDIKKQREGDWLIQRTGITDSIEEDEINVKREVNMETVKIELITIVGLR